MINSTSFFWPKQVQSQEELKECMATVNVQSSLGSGQSQEGLGKGAAP